MTRSQFKSKSESISRTLRRRHARRAFLLIDMMLGIALLALIFGSTTFVLAGLTRQRRITAQRFLANETVANILEETATWESFPIGATATDNITLPKDVIRRIPGAELRIDVTTPVTDGIAGQQITCQISWPSTADQPPHRVALTTWRFAP